GLWVREALPIIQCCSATWLKYRENEGHVQVVFLLQCNSLETTLAGASRSAVDLERRLAWVHLDEAKARKAIPMPFNGEAASILQKQIGKHREMVFTFKGQASVQLS